MILTKAVVGGSAVALSTYTAASNQRKKSFGCTIVNLASMVILPIQLHSSINKPAFNPLIAVPLIPLLFVKLEFFTTAGFGPQIKTVHRLSVLMAIEVLLVKLQFKIVSEPSKLQKMRFRHRQLDWSQNCNFRDL